jgi:hypothetical protein
MMNDNDKKIFEYIKEKSKQDKEIWHESQKDHNTALSLEKEESIVERMFLVHFTDRYLEQEKEIEAASRYIEENEVIHVKTKRDIPTVIEYQGRRYILDHADHRKG